MQRKQRKREKKLHDKTSIEQIIFVFAACICSYANVKRIQSDAISLIIMTENEDETLKRDE